MKTVFCHYRTEVRKSTDAAAEWQDVWLKGTLLIERTLKVFKELLENPVSSLDD